MIKNNFRILKKTHANLQTIAKAPVKFQKDWPKTVGGVEGTRYLLKIRNHAPRTTYHALRKAENSVPPLFFEKAGDNNPTKIENTRFFQDGGQMILTLQIRWSIRNWVVIGVTRLCDTNQKHKKKTDVFPQTLAGKDDSRLKSTRGLGDRDYYEVYEFCPNCWIWLVAMATKNLNLRKNIKKSSPQKP